MLVESWQLMKVSKSRPGPGALGLWSGLADFGLVPPGLNRPEILLPVLANTEGAKLAVVEQGGRVLLGIAMIGNRTLSSSLSNSGLPLIDTHLGEAALTAMLRGLPGPIVLSGIPATGPFWEALNKAAGHFAVLDRWERAGLALSGTYEDWFQQNFDRKRRNGLRRARAKFQALPDFKCELLKAEEDVAPWAAELSTLEAAGWKGQRGTALQQAGMAGAFADAARNLHAAGKLRFWRMTAEGHTLAMVFAVVDRGHAAFGKIAYNESYAQHSPGVAIILAATETLFAEDGMVLIDSCAIPNHPMLDHIWRDRIAMADVMVAGSNMGKPRFRLAAAREKTARALKDGARRLFYRLSGRKRV